MSGPGKIPVMVLIVGMFTFSVPQLTHAQNQNNLRAQNQNRRAQAQNGEHRPGDWLRSNQGKSFAQQKQALENDPDYKKLPPERQEQLKQRLQKFNSLPPEQQQRILQRIDKFNRMTPQQRAQARALSDRMRNLPDDRRMAVRQQIRALVGMPPAARERVMNSDQFNRQYSPDEKEIMGRALELNDQGASQAPEEAGSAR